MRLLILFILSPLFLFSQVQIGNDIDGVAHGDSSGYVSFSSDGTIVAIGGPGNDATGTDAGHVRVFENISGVWTQIGNDINGDAAGDNFGASVSVSSDGSIIAIGAPYNNIGGTDAGNVRVFENIGGIWTQIGDAINGDTAEDRLGLFVSLSNDGTKLAIAGYACCGLQHGIPSVGKTRIYENISDDWTIIGEEVNTGFSGISDVILSADGSVVAIASPGGGNPWLSNFYSSGVEVYKNVFGVWTPIALFVGELSSDFLYNYFGGISLTIDGSKIAIAGSEYTRVYETISDEWVQLGEDITGTEYFATNISLSDDGTILAVGGPVTRLYENSSNIWTQFGRDINEEAPDDGFGRSIELSSDGTTLVVGAPENDGNGIDSGHARVFDLSALLSVKKHNHFNVKLYPNPAQNQFAIQLGDSRKLKQVTIYSSLGQLIQTSQNNIINTSKLAPGIYYVEVITNQGKATKKLIIK